jgi:hypothetical protein
LATLSSNTLSELAISNNVMIYQLDSSFQFHHVIPFTFSQSLPSDAFVVMLDHLHAVWTLPEDGSDYSIRWRNIKRAFTASIAESQRPIVSASRQHKSEQAIWQQRFWECQQTGGLAVSIVISDKVFCQPIGYIDFGLG